MSPREVTTPEELAEEGPVELSLRPQRLAEFIGQQKVKDSLRIYIDAALSRRDPLRSVAARGWMAAAAFHTRPSLAHSGWVDSTPARR